MSSGAGGATGVAGPGGTPGGGSGGFAGTSAVGVAGTSGTDQGDAGGSGGNSVAADALVDPSGAARDGGTQTPECPAERGFEFRAIFVGTGFDRYEGKTLVAVTSDSGCRASGTTRIQDGAFQVEVVNRATSAYPILSAFVDMDENGESVPCIDAQWQSIMAWGHLTPTRTINLNVANFSLTGNYCGP